MINLCEKGRTEDDMVDVVNCTAIKVALKNDLPKRQKLSTSKVSKESKQWNADDLESWL